jgi:hypothetical protein
MYRLGAHYEQTAPIQNSKLLSNRCVLRRAISSNVTSSTCPVRAATTAHQPIFCAATSRQNVPWVRAGAVRGSRQRARV